MPTSRRGGNMNPGSITEVECVFLSLGDHCAGNRNSTPLRPLLLPGDIGPGEELEQSFFLDHSQTHDATRINMPFLQEDFAAPLLRYLKGRTVFVPYTRRHGRPPGPRLGMHLRLARAFSIVYVTGAVTYTRFCANLTNLDDIRCGKSWISFRLRVFYGAFLEVSGDQR